MHRHTHTHTLYVYFWTSMPFPLSNFSIHKCLEKHKIPGLWITFLPVEGILHSDAHLDKLKLNSKHSKFSSKCCQRKKTLF